MKKVFDEKRIAEIGRSFGLWGDLISSGPYGSGHINDTYAVKYSQAGVGVRYIFQRINHTVFRNVPHLMENIERVTDHLHTKRIAEGMSDRSRSALALVKTEDGLPYLKEAEDSYWRAYYFIEGAQTYDRVSTPDQAKSAAAAFARFQKDLSDLEGKPLHETIPDFHHTIKRFDRLNQLVESDPLNRAHKALSVIEGYQSFEQLYGVVVNGIESGRLPVRVTHNDTKFNNVMIDDQTGEGICVIDLDTVMNGSVLYDFGDLVRSATNAGMEDDADPENVYMREDVFTGIVEGYVREARGFLVSAEVELLAQAGMLITLEIGMRFLTDFIEGDVYFKKHREEHNLDRAKNQLLLAQSMKRKLDWMQETVEKAVQ